MSINQSLMATMPHRTLEAIKGHRRHPDYKSLVELYTVSLPWRPEVVQAEVMADPCPGSTGENVTMLPVESPSLVTQVTRHSAPSPPPPPPDTANRMIPIPRYDSDRGDDTGKPGVDENENDMNDYQWRESLRAALASQAETALIDPELLTYVTQAPRGDPGIIQTTIDRDLLGLLPPVEGRGHQDQPPCQEARNARARRRAQYSRIQALYRKSRRACASTVLASQWKGMTPALPLARQTAYWRPLFETPSIRDSREPSRARPIWDIVHPFSDEEVARSLRAMKDGAPGPDHVTKEQMSILPVAQLTCQFNIWLLLGIAPHSFRNGITVLTPKSGDVVEPVQFRPITIGPILCRLFHRILAKGSKLAIQ